MFGIWKISNILSSLNAILVKANQTIHESKTAAAKTTEHVKPAASVVMTNYDSERSKRLWGHISM
jgi:hypothetical protein